MRTAHWGAVPALKFTAEEHALYIHTVAKAAHNQADHDSRGFVISGLEKNGNCPKCRSPNLQLNCTSQQLGKGHAGLGQMDLCQEQSLSQRAGKCQTTSIGGVEKHPWGQRGLIQQLLKPWGSLGSWQDSSQVSSLASVTSSAWPSQGSSLAWLSGVTRQPVDWLPRPFQATSSA